MSVDALRRALSDESVKNDLFRLLESETFDAQILRDLYPDLRQQWTDVAAAMQVPWQYVMVLDLSLAASMAPTAVLFPLPTLQIYPVVWWFLLHPGATNTSAVVRLFADVLDLLEREMNKRRDDLRADWANSNAGHRPGQNPFTGAVSVTGGSGSLEGEGKLMALPQNFGRSISFMTEGKRLLKWLQSEGALNESIVVELWERLGLKFWMFFHPCCIVSYTLAVFFVAVRGMKWKRPTVNADRTFTVDCPFFLAAGALHVEDLLELYGLNDPLGVRGRLGLFYARPTFKRAHEVEAAANAIAPERRGLENLLLRKFRSAWQAHDPMHCASPALFEEFKGYRFRVYTLSGEAKTHFFAIFDQHTLAHEKAHLTNMSDAKFHSKAKTKFLRHSLAVHISEQARQCLEPQAWNAALSKEALQFGQLLSDYMDKVDSTLNTFLADLLAKLQSSTREAVARNGGVAALGKASVRSQLQQILVQQLDAYKNMDKSTAKTVLEIVYVLLKQNTAWLDSSVMLKLQALKDILQGRNQADHLHLYARAVALIHRVGLGAAGLGTNAHGTPLVFLVKRVLARESPAYTSYCNVLSALNFPLRSYHVVPHSGDEAPTSPPASPSLTLPPEISLDAAEGTCETLRAFVMAAS